MNFKAIQTALSPNNGFLDTIVAFWEIIFPANWLFWKNGKARTRLEEKFSKKFGFQNVRAVANGRDGLYLILKSLELSPGSEVIVQAFTCMVVINPILWNGLKPIYIDIDERNLSLNASHLEKLISKNTKAVILQHSFGISGEIGKVRRICEEKGLILIEDCAHTVGGKIGEQFLGSFGDFSFFSFGRSKSMSCVSGGMVICNNEKFWPKIQENYRQLPEVGAITILRNLLHPLICSLAKTFYGFGKLGQLIMVLAQKLKILTLEVTPDEKRAQLPSAPAKKLPNVLAKLAIIQLNLIGFLNNHRKAVTMVYEEELKMNGIKFFQKEEGNFLLRMPLLVKNPAAIFKKLKRENIYLGDWYRTPIAPPDSDLGKTGYQPGSCPTAEKICKEIINLPLHRRISISDAKIIAKEINEILK